MQHPFEALKSEYSQLLSIMVVNPKAVASIDAIAKKILTYRSKFEEVTSAIGVPVVFSGPSFEREADLDFNDSPAQGDPWRKVSVHEPRGLGPYPSWEAAAVASYKREGLDRIGAGKWTWELVCYYGELFNGFGYRDFHHEHSPYLWGGTNIQQLGKYTSDGHFEEVMDTQLGMIPVARRIAQIAPELDLASSGLVVPMAPKPSGIATSSNPVHNVTWLQTMLNELGFDISIDGSYGRETKRVVTSFQREFGLHVDGYAGPETLAAVAKAVDNSKQVTDATK